jgi:Subtilase family
VFWRRALPLALALVLVANATAIARDGLEQVGTSYLMEKLGGSASDWQLTSWSWGPDPSTGEQIWVAKYLDLRSDEMVGVLANAQGRILGFDDLAVRQAAADKALPAFEQKADRGLQEFLGDSDRGIPGHEQASVGIFVSADTSGAVQAVRSTHPEIAWVGNQPSPATQLQANTIKRELHDARATVYAAAENSITPEIEALGGKLIYASSAAPLIFVTMPTARLRALAELPDATDLGLEGTWHEAMDIAGPTIDADWTTSTNPGDQGTGVKVAVVEYNSVYDTGDLNGRVSSWYNAATNQTGESHACYDPVYNHPTWVAGAIAGTSGSYPGVAPGAFIVSAATCGSDITTNDHDVVEAADAAIGLGADILNLSIVQDTSSGLETARKYFDAVAYEQATLVVAATGNLEDCGTYDATHNEWVGSPGVGWNVLTVGGTYDQGTTSRSDDRLYYDPNTGHGACWVDPAGTTWNTQPDPDFNKPEVSAPAYLIRTANGLNASGTSVASPMVAGIAAQLGARNATVKSSPRILKAMIMAGAVWGAPLPSEYGGYWSTDHQGVGVVSAKWANKILDGSAGGYYAGTFTNASQYKTLTFSIATGQRAQVAIAWTSQTAGSNKWAKADALTTDLDLIVTLPNGTHKYSDSARNAWEYVDFTSASSGTVTIKVDVYRLDGAAQDYAVAWVKLY